MQIIGLTEFGNTRCDYSQYNKKLNLKKDYVEKLTETTVIETQSQNLGGNRKLPMKINVC